MPVASQLYLNLVQYYQDTGVFPKPFNGIAIEIKSDPYGIDCPKLHTYTVDDKGVFEMFDPAINEGITDFQMTVCDITKVEHMTIDILMRNYMNQYKTK